MPRHHHHQQQQQQQQQQSVWLWRSDYETWEMFNQEDMAKMERAQAAYSNGLVLERKDNVYYIDLLNKTQTNTDTGRMRLLQHVTSGSQWIFQDSPSAASPTDGDENQSSEERGQWTAFSKQDTAKLEAALFAGQDCVILDRDSETLYVDLQRWTLNNLTTNTTRAIKLATEERDAKPAAVQVSTVPNDEDSRAYTAPSITKPQSSRTSQTSWERSSEGSERTCSTTSAAESESSLEEAPEELAHPYASNASDEVLWLWRDDQGLWSTFDDQIANDIEASFAKGETGVVVQRGSDSNGGDGVCYFLDLVEMTQTNLMSGYIRNIERREDW